MNCVCDTNITIELLLYLSVLRLVLLLELLSVDFRAILVGIAVGLELGVARKAKSDRSRMVCKCMKRREEGNNDGIPQK